MMKNIKILFNLLVCLSTTYSSNSQNISPDSLQQLLRSNPKNFYKQLKGKKPIFFPTDVSYNLNTVPNQAAYTVDVKMRYNPANWGRPGADRIVQFTDCIVQYVPKPYVTILDADRRRPASHKPRETPSASAGAPRWRSGC